MNGGRIRRLCKGHLQLQTGCYKMQVTTPGHCAISNKQASQCLVALNTTPKDLLGGFRARRHCLVCLYISSTVPWEMRPLFFINWPEKCDLCFLSARCKLFCYIVKSGLWLRQIFRDPLLQIYILLYSVSVLCRWQGAKLQCIWSTLI